MERHKNFNSQPRRGGVWAFIGYLSFGVLGILLGAAIVYGLFIHLLGPATEETIPKDPPGEVDEAPIDEPLPAPERDSDIVAVVEEVMPAVVGVSSHRAIGNFEEKNIEEAESASGVIVSSDGYIVTNQHVIEQAEEIMVVIPEVGQYEAELIGEDALTDLALLKIEASELTYVPFADSRETRVGETVLAIGNPLGLQQTVTAGIVSAVERQVFIPGTEYAHTFIQIDAVVNPGNSGGPLVNLNGEIVGINTAKVALTGVEGIGLSIPSSTVDRVINDLLEFGQVHRPHMGVLIESWINYDDPEPDKGIRLVEVVPDSPAEEAGLQKGDIIVAVDGQSTEYLAKLFDQLLTYYPGDTITITFYRDGEQKETDLTLEERPDDLGQEPAFPEDEEDLEEYFEEEFFD
ncbi:MAG: trypsin-like peptidase domain-containing protein [Bacillota bacterium]